MKNHAEPDNIAVLVVSRDDAFVASLASALQESRELLHAPNMATAENLVIAHKIGVVVTDRGTTQQEIKLIANRLRPITPQLVIVVAGDRSHANDLLDLITSGDIYRFLLTPLAPGQTRVCIESAISRFAMTANQEPASLELAQDAPSFNAMPWLAGAVIALLLLTGGWLLLTRDNQSPGPGETSENPLPTAQAAPQAMPSTSSESRLAAVDRSLTLANEAMADQRFIEPIGANALYFYRSVLAAEPQNVEARQGMDTIVRTLLARCNEALAIDDVDAARKSLAIARSIQPGNAELGELQARLNAKSEVEAIARAEQLAAAQNFDAALAIVATQPDTPGIQAVRARIVSAQQTAQAEQSIQRMAALIATDQLMQPQEDNALYHARAALALAPENPGLVAAVAGLAGLLVQRATEATAAGDFAAADQWLAGVDALGTSQAAADSARKANLAAMAGQQQALAIDAANAERLDLAAERIESNLLIDPAGDSAYFYLEQVRASDGSNPELPAAEKLLADALLFSAGQRIGNGQYDEADRLLDSAVAIGAAPGAVAAQRRAVESALAAQAVQPPPYISTQELTRTRYVAPTYPPAALRRGQEGSVLLEFTLALDGSVKEIDVVESNPASVFNRAAIRALSKWQFEPYVVNEQAQEARVRVDLSFVLD